MRNSQGCREILHFAPQGLFFIIQAQRYVADAQRERTARASGKDSSWKSKG